MSGAWSGVRRVRVALGTAGGLLAAFGIFRLLTEVPGRSLLGLGIWLGGALVLHDAVLSPGIIGLGRLLARIPDRARGYVQGALVAGGLVTVVAVPMIYREGSQPRAEAILDQDFRANLAILLALIAAGALLAYLRRVQRESSLAASGRRPERSGPTAGQR